MSGGNNSTHGLRNIWSPIVRRLRFWSQFSRERMEKRLSDECGQTDKDASGLQGLEEEEADQKNKPPGKTNSMSEMTRLQTESSSGLSGEIANDKCATEKENRRLVQHRKLGQCQSEDSTSFNTKDTIKHTLTTIEDDKSKESPGWNREAARSGLRKSSSSAGQRLSMDETRRRMESWRRVTKPRRSETYINPSELVQHQTTSRRNRLLRQSTEEAIVTDRSKSFVSPSSSQKRPLRARKSAPLLPVTQERFSQNNSTSQRMTKLLYSQQWNRRFYNWCKLSLK